MHHCDSPAGPVAGGVYPYPGGPAVRRSLAPPARFDGLPAGVTRWRLAAALRAAARTLGLGPSMLRLLEHYIDLSRDADWQAGSEPVITRPLIEIAEALDLGERQIRNIEHALAARGLLAWRDGGNHRRHGRRDHRTGRLLWAYGPTLAPLGQRAAEIVALAEAARAEAGEARRLRLGLSALRRKLGALAEEAAQRGEAATAARAAAALTLQPLRHRAGEGLDTLRARHATLTAAVESLTGTLVPDGAEPNSAICRETAAPVSAARPETGCRPLPDTDSKIAMNGTSSGAEKRPRLTGLRASPPASGRTRPDGPPPRADTVPLSLAARCAGPALRAALGSDRDDPGWPALIEAARAMSRLVGLDDEAWGQACQALGRDRAALCVLILERRLMGPEPAVRHPRAYLGAMVARGQRHELRLGPSLRALDPLRRSPAAGPR